MVDHPPDQEETPELQGSYTVGDYINLDLTIWHAMHIVEASVVFVLVVDDTVELVIAGLPTLEESDAWSMRSVMRVSRRVTLEDVPGTYSLSRLEVVTASTRSLTKEYARRPTFEIVPEPNEWNVTMNLGQRTREPLYPTDDEGDEG